MPPRLKNGGRKNFVTAAKMRAGKPEPGYTIPDDLAAQGFKAASIPSREAAVVQSPGGTKRVANSDLFRDRVATIWPFRHIGCDYFFTVNIHPEHLFQKLPLGSGKTVLAGFYILGHTR